MGIVPSTALFQAESNNLSAASNAIVIGTGIGSALTVAGNSTINLNGANFTQVQLGDTIFNDGSTLNLTTTAGVNGKALRIGGATFGTGVTLNGAGDGTYGADLYIDGVLNDGGTAKTIAKTGKGRLVLSQTALANSIVAGTTFNVQAGTLHLIGSSAAGSNNPIGPAGIRLSGGNVVIDSKIGSTTSAMTFANNITVTETGTIQDIVTGGALVELSGPISIAAGKTLSLNVVAGGNPATSLGALVRLTGSITGAGNLNLTSSKIGTLPITPVGGRVIMLANRSGHTGQLTVSNNAVAVFPTINTAVGSVGAPGLNAYYYNFGNNPGANNNPQQYAVDQLYLNRRVFLRTDSNVNLPNSGSGNWPVVPVPGYAVTTAGGQQDGVMWKGLLNITTAGSYQFSGTNDDNLLLIIDGVQVGTLGVTSTNANIGGAQTLSAGRHSIVVKQSQGGGGGYATLSYNGPDTASSTVLIPNSALTTGSLAPLNLGAFGVSGGAVDIPGPATATSLSLGNGTFTLTSATIDNLTAAGGTIVSATPTLAPTTAGLIVTGAIGDGGSGFGLNVAGPYFTEFSGANTYTGTTTVTGGQLLLNTTGANSIAGNLTVNAANAGGAVANVRLLKVNQIADTATLTMTAGILDMDGFNRTIANLNVDGGFILGSGTLTVNGAANMTAGYVGPGLAGNLTLAKNGAGHCRTRRRRQLHRHDQHQCRHPGGPGAERAGAGRGQ